MSKEVEIYLKLLHKGWLSIFLIINSKVNKVNSKVNKVKSDFCEWLIIIKCLHVDW